MDMFALTDPAPIILKMQADFIVAIIIGGIGASLVALLLSFPDLELEGTI